MSNLMFQLEDDFVKDFGRTPVDWGFPCGGGNSLGEITFYRTYSREKPDGSKERWHETVRRFIEGMYHEQKRWALQNKLPWSDDKAQRSAQEAYEYAFKGLWLPPGRGIWMMGTDFVHERRVAAALLNCGYTDTDDVEDSMAWLMEASMLGVGVGFNTAGASALVRKPSGRFKYVIPDSREGWVQSLRYLLRAYLYEEPIPIFDYSEIRPAGYPIKGFGGVAAGATPLIEMHELLVEEVFGPKQGSQLGTDGIVDIANLIGKCVVAGNIRRSALIAFGESDDDTFVDLKDYEKYPQRNDAKTGWGWTSNNSTIAEVGQTDYGAIVESNLRMSEPGIFWLNLAREYGRMADPPDNKDWRITGANPCSEQSLESRELCTLVETFPARHESLDQYRRTLKFAYLYAKTVTLMSTHWPESNAIMLRNRRIGCSMTGVARFAEERSVPELRVWMDEGYKEIRRRDEQYSEWLCVRESIKATSIKPSGSVSLLFGEWPGVHWQVAAPNYIRRIRMAMDSPLVAALTEAGYDVEPSQNDSTTAVVSFPISTADRRTQNDVSVWEKAHLAALAQRYWADNQVSVTLSFDPKAEGEQLGSVLHAFEGSLKSVSFEALATGYYAQTPYEEVAPETISRMMGNVRPLPWSDLYASGEDAIGERYCTTDRCEV